MKTAACEQAACRGCALERWADVADFPGYMVSDHGRVVSLMSGARRPLKQRRHPRVGYATVSLQRPNKTGAQRHVHALVLRAFGRDRGAREQCRHLDGDPQHNHHANLTWGTSVENNGDKYRHGTLPVGELVCSAKLTWEAVRWARWAHAYAGVTRVRLAAAFGVTHTAMNHAIAGLTWKVPPTTRRPAPAAGERL